MIQSQCAGGTLLPPVQKLVASLFPASGQESNESG